MDQLPTGPEWHCEVITAQGDIIDEGGSRMVEHLDLWFRNPVECVRELLSNPAFIDFISYGPEYVYSDSEGKKEYSTRCGQAIGGGKCRWVRIWLFRNDH